MPEVWNACLCWKYCQLCTFLWKNVLIIFWWSPLRFLLLQQLTPPTSKLLTYKRLCCIVQHSCTMTSPVSYERCIMWSFHALEWLGKCWFTGSICRQSFLLFFFTAKVPESCLHLHLRHGCALWCIPDLRVLAGHVFVMHLWCHDNFLVFWRQSEDTWI